MGIPHLAVCSACKKPNRVFNFTRVTQAACQNCRKNLSLLSDPLLFQTIFDHELLSVIGMGGMGKVYLAQNVKWKNYVAVKAQIHQETSVDQRDQFWNEARILKDFDHPNIIKFIGAMETEMGSFLFMEYFPSLKLSQFVLQHYPLSVSQTITILQEICFALFHVHQRGYIHRDLKPNNILVGETNALRLIDFGISVARGVTLKEEKAMGTLSYMAPEQLLNKDIDERTDIYAIGSILFFILTGQKPFEGADSLYHMKQQFQESLVQLIKKPRQYPKPLLSLLEKMTYPEKEKRFSSISEILKELHSLHQKEFSLASRSKRIRFRKKFSVFRKNSSSDLWQAAKISTKPRWMSWQNGSVSFLFLLLFGIIGHSVFFSRDSRWLSKKNQTPPTIVPDPETYSFIVSDVVLVYPALANLEQELTLSQLKIFLQDYPQWEPIREKTFRLRIKTLKEPLLPVFYEFLKQENSDMLWTGAFLLLDRFDWEEFPLEWVEFILDSKSLQTNRKKLFQWMLSQKLLSPFLPYHKSLELLNVMSWAPEKVLFSLIQSLLQTNKAFKDSRLFEFIQICSEPDRLLLEMQGAEEEGTLRYMIVAKYQKYTFSEKQLETLFLKSSFWKKLCNFLYLIQTGKSMEQLWLLFSKVPFHSEKGQFLWSILKDNSSFVNLEMTPFLSYLKQFQDSEEQKKFIQKLHQVSGINLSFVSEFEKEYKRLLQMRGNHGFQLGWKQDLAGFLLASLSKNFAFEAFYFERLQKNQFENIDFFVQLEAARTTPIFFQELLTAWLLTRYPNAKFSNNSAKNFSEKESLAQYREGLEKLVEQFFLFLEENKIPDVSFTTIRFHKSRFKIRQAIATTELQKVVGLYYTFIELIALFAPEAIRIRVQEMFQKKDPLCTNAEEQILLALNILTFLLYQFDPDPLFLMVEE